MLLLENISHDELKKYIKEFYTYALSHLKKIDRKPKIVFKTNQKNADDFFGKTGYYDPEEEKIVLYITDRHPKDILRSFAHELIHHHQKCSGESDKVDLSATSDPSYSLHNKDLRNMEKQAFRWGNMIFRDWCDTKKQERKNIMAESKEKKKEKGTTLQRKNPDYEKTGLAKLNAANRKRKKTGKEEPEKTEINKKASDLNKDGELDDYETARGEAIARSMAKQKTKKESAGFGEGPEGKERLQESSDHPYPQLFQKKDRLHNERFSKYEEFLFEELLKKAIKK